MTKFRLSDWSVRLARSCMCHTVSPCRIRLVLCVISTTELEYLTVKIKEGFELVIEVHAVCASNKVHT